VDELEDPLPPAVVVGTAVADGELTPVPAGTLDVAGTTEMRVQGQFVIVRVVADETVYVMLFCTMVVALGQYVVYAVTIFGED
jgi:hypothetical protein